jgi:hypothetical protein
MRISLSTPSLRNRRLAFSSCRRFRPIYRDDGALCTEAAGR